MSTPGPRLPLHLPVMLSEVREALDPAPGRTIADVTLGLGGHAGALLEAGARVLGLDRDPESIAIARARLAGFEADGRFHAVCSDYRRLLAVLAAEGTGPLDGILADLGVSSFQLLTPERGFSFTEEGPLDMRMDRSTGRTAADLVNSLPEADLARLIRAFGEERQARRIARAIVRRREQSPIATTRDLAETIAAAARRRRPGAGRTLHPATLTFQALRIAVNDELTGIDRFVEDAVSALARGGRIAIIAFHSLEDRQVKHALRRLEKGCICPPEMPICGCGKRPQIRLLHRRPRFPGEDERRDNPRARSARLRAAEKVTGEIAPELRAA